MGFIPLRITFRKIVSLMINRAAVIRIDIIIHRRRVNKNRPKRALISMILKSRPSHHGKHFAADDVLRRETFAYVVVVEALEFFEIRVVMGIGFWVFCGETR
jgi:hypothetical protein